MLQIVPSDLYRTLYTKKHINRCPNQHLTIITSSNLGPNLQPHPGPLRLDHLRRHPKTHTSKQTRTRIHLRANIPPALSLNNRPSNRRARQHRKTHNRKRHTHPRPLLPRVARQLAQRRREQALDRAGGEAVKGRPHIEPRCGGDGDPAVHEDAGGEGHGDEGVYGADAVGDVAGEDAAGDADAVEDEEEVKGVVVGEADDVAGVGG